MPISALVITLENAPADVEQALQTLRAHRLLTVGEPLEGRVPVVAEPSSLEEGERLHRWLLTLPQVVHVDVIGVHWDDTEEAASG